MYLNAKNPVSSEEICQARLTTARDSEFGIQDSGFGIRDSGVGSSPSPCVLFPDRPVFFALFRRTSDLICI